MGGSIGVTIREEDGTEHRMCRWTNSLPGFIHNLKFINKDKDYLKEYLKMWEKMRKDWIENKDNKDKKFFSEPVEIGSIKVGGGIPQEFRYNMTSAYAPYPFLAPMDYGLVVIDIKNDIILHSQGYCSIGSFITSRASFNKEDVKIISELNKNKRILKVTDDDDKKVKEIVINPKQTYFYNIKVDLSPFKVKKFEKSPKGTKELKREIIKLGFKITEEEEKMWEEYIKNQED